MNAQQRKELDRIKSQIEDLMGSIESIRDEEQDKLDNMPENLQNSDRYQNMEQELVIWMMLYQTLSLWLAIWRKPLVNNKLKGYELSNDHLSNVDTGHQHDHAL